MLTNCGTETIETERLLLRRFELGDTEAVLKNWASDEKIQALYSEPTYNTYDEVYNLLLNYITRYVEKDYYRWAIVEKESNQCIGQFAIFSVDNKNHFGELEYCIGSAFQKKGYCTEATKTVLRFAFEKINVHKIQICHKEGNVASQKVILNCGCVYEGMLRDYFYINGQYVGRLYYSLLASEWQEQQK